MPSHLPSATETTRPLPDRDRRRTPSRRQVARGAAWAVPTLVVGTAAPALAASGCIPVTGSTLTAQLAFGGASGANGWTAGGSGSFYGSTARPNWASTYTQNGANNSVTGCSSRPFPSNSIALGTSSTDGVVIGNPDPSRADGRLTYSKTLCLGPGTYALAYDWVSLTYNSVGSTLRLTATRDGGTAATIGSDVIAQPGNATSNQFGSGSRSGSLTVPTSNTYTFTYTWTFTVATSYGSVNDCPTFANDIAVTAPRTT